MIDILEQAELVAERAFAGAAQIGKIPGASIGCSGTFKHKGSGGTCYISWGIAYGSDVIGVYNDTKIVWVIQQQAIIVGDDAADKTYNFSLTSTFPTISPGAGMLEGNFFDCYLVIEMPKGTVKTNKWIDDIYYRSDLVTAEFKDIAATFS